MGADLYIGSYDNSQGYFRDSYNDTDLLWQLDLSWWQNVIPLCDENGLMNTENIKAFRQMIVDHPLPPFSDFRNPFSADPSQGSYDYFVKKYATLLAFIDKALELKLPIDASL